MLTLRAAAQLLAQADSRLALRPIAQAMGFTATPTALSADGRARLHIDALATSAELVRGPGTLRLLCAELAPPVDLAGATDPRELTRRLATTLLQQAPARHWCLVTLDARLRTLCIATIGAHHSGPRVAALRIDRHRVVDSDADTLRTLAAVSEPDALLRHARFTDILRRDALSSRFYGILERAVATLATDATSAPAHPPTPAERRELALLCTSRCLFLAFLEAKGWLDHRVDFLLHHTTAQLEQGGQLHQRLLRPLFFGTLNTPHRDRAPAARRFGAVPFLNGGLFSPTPLERRYRALRFSDDAIAHLVGSVLDRHRFTAHEDSASWSEAAIDPEMLGRAFESLMATDERRRSGSFYTPPALVDRVVRDALFSALPDLPPDALDDTTAPLVLSPATTDALHRLRILDPACGSGAFLVHMLERLGTLHRRTRLAASASALSDTHRIRRQLLTHCIFGVDRNPVAVWLCELRLWLSVVIECAETDIARVPPLPNLDHHIRVGDSLAGGNFRFAPPSARTLTALRERYTRATGPRKQSIAVALQREERQRAIAEVTRRRDALRTERATLLGALRARDLFGQRRTPNRADHARLDALREQCRELSASRAKLADGGALPFRFVTYFADVAAAGGFDVVIGNPPWVRPHALAHADRAQLRREFRSMRAATWHAGATRAGAGVGFASQPDLAVAFIERSLELLAPGGTLALLVPAKLWRTLSGGGIRRTIAQHASIHTIRDWSDAPALFDAATYPSLLVARTLPRATSHTPAPTALPDIAVTITRGHAEHHFALPASRLSLDHDSAAPWVLLPPDARSAFERLRTAGPALGDSRIGRPLLGVKCGCNAAFLVHASEHDDDSATVVASDNPASGVAAVRRSAVIERRLLRPALRGEGITVRTTAAVPGVPGVPPDELRILWTHGLDGLPLRTLPPATTRWLAHWRPRLESRRDARARMPWWTLFRTEAARADTPRVVWADIGKRLRTRVLHAGDPTVPLNSCYVVRTAQLDDAYALDAVLNSTIAAAWLDVLAEPARGGFRRFLGWTVASLPVPHDWLRARTLLAPIGHHLATGGAVPIEEHDLAVADAYDVPLRHLTPLLDWYTP